MNRLVLISLLIIAFLPGYPQYFGGNDDGFSALSFAVTPLSNQAAYCSGGNEDGFSMIETGNLTINNHVLYCSGGNDDGSAKAGVSGYFFNPAPYYSGGINDGFSPISTGNTNFSDQAIYVSGGISDGFSILNTGQTTICDQSVYVSGGVSDGFAAQSTGNSNICNTSVYASGGNGDGFAKIHFSGAIYYPTAWLGGNSDGFAVLHSPVLGLAPTFFCLGGNNDGSSSLTLPVTYFGNGIWLGASNTSWYNAANWSFSYIPDLSVNVIIPAGRTFYPLITSGNLTINTAGNGPVCHSLTIQEGGSVVNKTNLFVNGDFIISGLYQADDDVHHDIVINPGGHLKLIAPGEVRIGNLR